MTALTGWLDLGTGVLILWYGGYLVLQNEKETFDAGLGEIRMLSLLGKHDAAAAHRLRLLDYFYFKVT